MDSSSDEEIITKIKNGSFCTYRFTPREQPIALHDSACGRKKEDFTRMSSLLVSNKSYYSVNKHRFNCLISAASEGHVECLEFFKTKNVLYDFRTGVYSYCSYLHAALQSNSLPTVQFVVEHLKDSFHLLKDHGTLTGSITTCTQAFPYGMCLNEPPVPNNLLRPLIKYLPHEDLAWVLRHSFVTLNMQLTMWLLRRAAGMFNNNQLPYDAEHVACFVHSYKLRSSSVRLQLLELLFQFDVPQVFVHAFFAERNSHNVQMPLDRYWLLDPHNPEYEVVGKVWQMYTNPRSLRSLCRLKVMRAMGPDYEYKMEQLPLLPVDVVDYMLFRDLVPNDVQI